ncbi:MAG: thioredoxin [Clostridia bacterium]|nr:thioredoxin [Clostridia bacterium]
MGNAALRRALLIAALILTVAGALNGSLRDVLYKAVNVCTECVGLG